MGIKKILVTGSAGYIGHVLTKKLDERGYRVFGIDSLFFDNLVSSKRTTPVIKKDIRHISEHELEGYDAVIHLAALSNDSLGELKSELTEEINFRATLDLAKKAKNAGVKRFIFASSCSIYGIAKNGVVNEKSLAKPLTAYAKSKVNSEKALKKLADKNFTVVLMRNATVYGFSHAFRDDLVVNNLVASGLTLGKIQIKSDGTPWRPLIDVRDLAEIIIRFLEIDSKKVNGEIINIGFNENNFQIKTLVSLINKRLKNSKVIFTNEHGSDTRSYRVEFDKFHKLFPHLKPGWDIEKSSADLIKNLTKHNYNKRHFLNGNFARINQLKELLKKDALTDKLFWKNQG